MSKVKFCGMFLIVLILFAGCSDKDKVAWEKAKSLNTIESYDEYIRMSPKGKFLNDAIGQQKLLSGEISGKLIGKKTGQPISDAYVLLAKTVKDPNGEKRAQISKSLSIKSDSEGKFKFDKIQPGEYLLVYALSDEVKGSSTEWDNLLVKYVGPFICSYSYDKGVEKADDPFGGKAGILLRTPRSKFYIGDLIITKDGRTLIDPKEGAVTSAQYGLSIEYVDKKPSLLSIEQGKTIETTVKISGK